MIPSLENNMKRKELDFSRIESLQEVESFIQNVIYALNNNANITIQFDRRVDEHRENKYTNRYTINKLFPKENPKDAIARELQKLKTEEYVETLADLRFPSKSEMRVFAKIYDSEQVYIKIRVELFDKNGKALAYIMSFHFAEHKYDEADFPYRESVKKDENN